MDRNALRLTEAQSVGNLTHTLSSKRDRLTFGSRINDIAYKAFRPPFREAVTVHSSAKMRRMMQGNPRGRTLIAS
jgi:hypothetical protein